jgi:hypothetical protein
MTDTDSDAMDKQEYRATIESLTHEAHTSPVITDEEIHDVIDELFPEHQRE